MKQALTTLTDDMKRVVKEQRLGYVATVCPNGTPNLSPKGTTLVWDDNTLVFADLRSPGTIENLLQNPTIEINVVDPISRTGYRFKGDATIVRDGPMFERALEFYENATGLARKRVRAVVLVSVSRALRLISPAYDTRRDEDSVRRQWIQHYLDLWGLQSLWASESGSEASDH